MPLRAFLARRQRSNDAIVKDSGIPQHGGDNPVAYIGNGNWRVGEDTGLGYRNDEVLRFG
jgi:hypothetical protein